MHTTDVLFPLHSTHSLSCSAIEGLTHDGIILNVSKCEMTAARTLEQAGEGGGNLPVILTTAQVQYIHTVRNRKVRGGEGCRKAAACLFDVNAQAACLRMERRALWLLDCVFKSQPHPALAFVAPTPLLRPFARLAMTTRRARSSRAAKARSALLFSFWPSRANTIPPLVSWQ